MYGQLTIGGDDHESIGTNSKCTIRCIEMEDNINITNKQNSQNTLFPLIYYITMIPTFWILCFS